MNDSITMLFRPGTTDQQLVARKLNPPPQPPLRAAPAALTTSLWLRKERAQGRTWDEATMRATGRDTCQPTWEGVSVPESGALTLCRMCYLLLLLMLVVVAVATGTPQYVGRNEI
uniref:Uncharacterized protein n=1 Tax=Anopheles coluzzii TaxID=1518534 RepID=A0A8W7PXT6_ANOCL